MQDEPEEVPEFISRKYPIPDLIFKDKREGKYWIGFPIIGYDPDAEFMMGASVRWFDNGPADSPFFRYTPYRTSTRVGAGYGTGGFGKVFIEFDAPNMYETPWRLRAGLTLSRNDFEHYFGVGEETLGNYQFPGSSQTYTSYDDFLDALDDVSNGETYERFESYRQDIYRLDLALEHDTFGGIFRPLVGLQFAYYSIDDYTGDKIDGAVIQPTKLRTDRDAGRIRGFDGGWDNALKLGATLDTRDFEPNPTRGYFLQGIGRFSLKPLGSNYNYAQFKLEGRAYHNFLKNEEQALILAARLGYVTQTGDVPFYALSLTPGVEEDFRGLGGATTLRGYPQNRFIGEHFAWANAELRWFFAETTVWNQHLRFGLAPFAEAGRVFDSFGDTTLDGWKPSYGVGFRLAWNVATVVSFDLGASEEGKYFYVEVGKQF